MNSSFDDVEMRDCSEDSTAAATGSRSSSTSSTSTSTSGVRGPGVKLKVPQYEGDAKSSDTQLTSLSYALGDDASATVQSTRLDDDSLMTEGATMDTQPPALVPRVSAPMALSSERKPLADDFGSDDDSSADSQQMDADNIQVLVRVRPLIDTERGGRCCVRVDEDNNAVHIECKPSAKSFVFDKVAGFESTQEQIFQMVGRPITNSCLRGYNGTIFAYGQTASGKTFTMEGDCDHPERRGLMPRVFDYLFSQIARQIQRRGADVVQYLVKVSCVEVYNEIVQDLLEPENSNLQIREDMRLGVFVNALSERGVANAQECLDAVRIAMMHRRVSSTSMNRESSRSHLILTLVVECCDKSTADGITRKRSARFNLVDLAGSERQSKTHSIGMRLREAGAINRSLLTLGHVMKALAQECKSEGGGRRKQHIHYRDSKLTFLLKDSLGGNSLTFMIANLSPASDNLLESLSTLQFASRAKFIKNQAKLNEDQSGTVLALKSENARLVDEIAKMKNRLLILQTPSLVMSRSKTRCVSLTTGGLEEDGTVEDLDMSLLPRGTLLRVPGSTDGKLTGSMQQMKDTLEILERQNLSLRQEKECMKEIAEKLRGAAKSHRDASMGLRMALKLRECALKRGSLLQTDWIEDRQQLAVAALSRDRGLLQEERIKCLELQKQLKSMMDFIHRFVQDEDNSVRYDQLQKWKHTYQTLVDSNQELRRQLEEAIGVVVSGDDFEDDGDYSEVASERSGASARSSRRRIVRVGGSLAAVKKAMCEKDSEIERLKQSVTATEEAMGQLKERQSATLATLEENDEAMRGERDRLKEEVSSLKTSIDELQSTMAFNTLKFEREKEELQKHFECELSDALGGIEVVRSTHSEENAKLKRGLAELRGDNEALLSELKNARENCRSQDVLVAALKGDIGELEDVKSDNETLRSELRLTMQNVDALSRAKAQVSLQLDSEKETVGGMRADLRKTKESLTKKESALSRVRAEYDRVEDELSELKISYDSTVEDKELVENAYQTLVAEKENLVAECREHCAERDSLKRRSDELAQRCTEHELGASDLRREMKESLTNSDSALSSQHSKNEALAMELKETRDKLTAANESTKEWSLRFEAKESELSAASSELQSTAERLTDFSSMYERLELKHKEQSKQLAESTESCDLWKEQAHVYNNELVSAQMETSQLRAENEGLMLRASDFEKEAQSSIDDMAAKLGKYSTDLKTAEAKRKQLTEDWRLEVAQLKSEIEEFKRKMQAAKRENDSVRNAMHLAAVSHSERQSALESEMNDLKQTLCEKQELLLFSQKQVEAFDEAMGDSPLKGRGSEDRNISDMLKHAEAKMARREAVLRDEKASLREDMRKLKASYKSTVKAMHSEFTESKEKQLAYNASLDELLSVRKRKCEELQKGHSEALSERNSMAVNLKRARFQRDEAMEECANLKEGMSSLQIVIETLNGDKCALEERWATERSRIEAMAGDLRRIKQQLNDSIRERMESVQTAKRMRLAEEKAYADMSEWKRRFNELEERYDRDKVQLATTLKRNATLETENTKLAAHNNERQRIKHLLDLKKENNALKREKKDLKRQLAALSKRFGVTTVSALAEDHSDEESKQSAEKVKAQLSRVCEASAAQSTAIRGLFAALSKAASKLESVPSQKAEESGDDSVVCAEDFDFYLSVVKAIRVDIDSKATELSALERRNGALQRDIEIQTEQLKLVRDSKKLTATFESLTSSRRKDSPRRRRKRSSGSKRTFDSDTEMRVDL